MTIPIARIGETHRTRLRRAIDWVFARRAVAVCSRCGCVRSGSDYDQELPRGTQEVCTGVVDFGSGPACIRLGVRLC